MSEMLKKRYKNFLMYTSLNYCVNSKLMENIENNNRIATAATKSSCPEVNLYAKSSRENKMKRKTF